MNTHNIDLAAEIWAAAQKMPGEGMEDAIERIETILEAALQSQSAPGWKEAFKAWNVCASIHREWAKGKDAVFTTRQADFVRHAEDAFKKSMGEDGLQSQDREGAFCVWHNDPETDNSWDTGCRQLFELYDGTPSENRMSFCCYCGKPIQEAIDHARHNEVEP